MGQKIPGRRRKRRHRSLIRVGDSHFEGPGAGRRWPCPVIVNRVDLSPGSHEGGITRHDSSGDEKIQGSGALRMSGSIGPRPAHKSLSVVARRVPSEDESTTSMTASTNLDSLPAFLTADETASLIRTTRKAVYTMAERGLLPGVTRIGRRLLVRRDVLLDWLGQKSAPSLER